MNTQTLSDIERFVFRVIELSSPHPKTLVDQVLKYQAALLGPPPFSEERIILAGRLLFERELIQITTLESLKRVRDFLQKHECGLPIFGFPEVGHLDVTELGTRQMHEKTSRGVASNQGYWAVCYGRHIRYFSVTALAIQRLKTYASLRGQTIVCGPTEIGPWKLNSAMSFQMGFALDIFDRNAALMEESQPTIAESFSRELGDSIFAEFASVYLGISMMRPQETLRSIEQFICIAMISGQFGVSGLIRKTAERCLARTSELLRLPSPQAPSEVIADLEATGIIDIASNVFTEIPPSSEAVQELGPNCLVLTGEGIKELDAIKKAFDSTGHWHNYVVGESILEESLLHYFESHAEAVDQVQRLRNGPNTVLVSEIENIGKWCPNWWEVKSQGFRFKCVQSGKGASANAE